MRKVSLNDDNFRFNYPDGTKRIKVGIKKCKQRKASSRLTFTIHNKNDSQIN